MLKGFLKRSLQRAAVLTATASMLLVFAPVEVEAAKPPPTPLTCSISPPDGSTAEGVPITFTGSTQGGKGKKSYSWDFSDGSGVPGTSTDTSVDVTYGSVGGPFAVLLDVTDREGATASCSTTVTVTQVGVNTPPVANDDDYPATINTPLNVPAPGVLGNDEDADGDSLCRAEMLPQHDHAERHRYQRVDEVAKGRFDDVIRRDCPHEDAPVDGEKDTSDQRRCGRTRRAKRLLQHAESFRADDDEEQEGHRPDD